MRKISVVLNTLNEAGTLPRAVASVKSIADEIIVIDMESTDNTVEVAKILGAKVFRHKKLSYVEPARNFGIEKASSEWVLILDTDEVVPDSLAKKITQTVKNTDLDYFRIPRKNIIFGKTMKHSRWWPDFNLRLFKKGFVSWNEMIHGVPVTMGAGGDFEAKEDFAIEHFHYDSVEQYVERMNRYTSVQADLKAQEGYKFRWRDIIQKPVNEFLSRYFFGEGYRDGLHGLALSLLQGFSEFVLYLKIWQAEKFKVKELEVKEVVEFMREQEKDIHFWQSDLLFKKEGKLLDRIKRKFKI
jgi:(heptosyl)LPS beta-1,4-glucosyltransferase